MDIHVNISALDDLADDLGEAERRIRGQAERVVRASTARGEALTKAYAPVDTGFLHSSVTSEVEVLGDTIRGEYGPEASYAHFVNGGTSRQAPNPFVDRATAVIKKPQFRAAARAGHRRPVRPRLMDPSRQHAAAIHGLIRSAVPSTVDVYLGKVDKADADLHLPLPGDLAAPGNPQRRLPRPLGRHLRTTTQITAAGTTVDEVLAALDRAADAMHCVTPTIPGRNCGQLRQLEGAAPPRPQ